MPSLFVWDPCRLRFDDRLNTMLAAPVADQRDRAVRWRQLVDVLSRAEPGATSELGERALETVRRDAFAIDEAVRAATIRAIAGRPLSPALLRVLAVQPVRVAAPLFAGLTMSAAEAAEVLADADEEVRALVRVSAEPMSPESVTPVIELPVEPVEAPVIVAEVPLRAEPAHAPARPPVVEPRVPPLTPNAMPSEGGRLFEWESDASGHIAWVAGAPRGALVGRPLGGDATGLLDREVAARLGQHHPFVDVTVALGAPLAGRWSATGVPAFDPATGRFLGYRGLARRTDGAPPPTDLEPAPDMDALRELVHEIKTPLNAIIGFAEIIDGQYLGPAHVRYRERAASIVGQARQLLDAVEDLDFAAKLRAERGAAERGGARLSELFPPIAAKVEQCLAEQGGRLEVDVDDERHRCALSPELAGRLLRRLLLSLCKLVERDEIFRIAVTRRGPMCALTIARPRVIDGLSEAQLVDPAFSLTDTGEERSVGLGFALRLVRGLAKVAGGGLVIDDHRITLQLPALDG